MIKCPLQLIVVWNESESAPFFFFFMRSFILQMQQSIICLFLSSALCSAAGGAGAVQGWPRAWDGAEPGGVTPKNSAAAANSCLPLTRGSAVLCLPWGTHPPMQAGNELSFSFVAPQQQGNSWKWVKYHTQIWKHSVSGSKIF